MAKFTLRYPTGKETTHEIKLNVFSVGRIAKATGVTLGLTPVMETVRRITDDPCFCAEAIFVAAKDLDMDQEKFGELMAADNCRAASQALLEAWSEFMPAQGREQLKVLTDGIERTHANLSKHLKEIDVNAIVDAHFAALNTGVQG